MEPQCLLRFLRLLEKMSLEYMVTGSIAAILYGKPRLTHDMDVVIIFPANKTEAFSKSFDLKEFYCPPLETLQDEVRKGDRGHFNIIDQQTGFKIDLYPFGNDPLVEWGLKNRRKIEILPKESVWLAPPEYVILKKLTYYKEGGSEKHLEDIRGILEVSGPSVDKKIIAGWAGKLSLEKEWALL